MSRGILLATHLKKRWPLVVLLLVLLYLPLATNLLKAVLVRHTTVAPSDHLMVQAADPPRAAGTVLQYPLLGIKTSVTLLPHHDPFYLQNWADIRQSLRQGVAAVYDSNDLTSATTITVIGHSSDTWPNPYAFIFAGLGQAKIGDTFTLSDHGQDMTFTVVEKKIFGPTDRPAFDSLQATSGLHKQRALLVTCWPVFSTARRLAVVGERSL